jgi:ATP-dependent helicase/nuclease subunit A
MQPIDQTERELALDINNSFIVQAPAGSGKTTLLVKRFLALLANANDPDEILAITFSRKAANEMSNRIVAALTDAATNNCNFNGAATNSLTILAQKVLVQDKIKNWNLLKIPQKLRIQTIDSFCNYLARLSPLSSNLQFTSTIVQNNDAENYYRYAAKAMLQHLNSNSHENPAATKALKDESNKFYAKSLETLLLYVGNDWEHLENLFVEMLRCREQWLPYIVGLKHTKDLRKKMEMSLYNISYEAIVRCNKYFVPHLQNELDILLKFAAENLGITNFDWNAKAQLLLTKEYVWRKKIGKNQGFPIINNDFKQEEKTIFKLMKERMETLLKQLGNNNYEELRIALQNILQAPPQTYSDNQWEIILALLELLPLLVAELKLLFQEAQATDYAEISIAALSALGEADNPSNIALLLDNQIKHILVDEFQDTSIAQFRLVEKLIAGWQIDDGRTIFLVGDPMQSIYLFRDAEVGLFVRVCLDGIGPIRPLQLNLANNFRATKSLVTWINNIFINIFPNVPDVAYGAIPFNLSYTQNINNDSAVTINLVSTSIDDHKTQENSVKSVNEITEAKAIAKLLIEIQQQYPTDSIALLIKSRGYLNAITPVLRQAQIKYQAVELETLSENALILDLFALTRAIVHPGDRIAWLAILRAPWCGLTLNDLYMVANGPYPTIWENICNFEQLPISNDGKIKLQSIKPPLLQIQQCYRHNISLRNLVEHTWQKLGGHKHINHESELENANLYFDLLEQNNQNILHIKNKLDELYVPLDHDIVTNIQIMTIHRAKGLEFDHVIIPGIDRTTCSDSKKLLLWMERPKIHGGNDLLLAPIIENGNNKNDIYKYLRAFKQQKASYENCRLLYVAATRAKKSLHLFGVNDSKTGSFLEQLYKCPNLTFNNIEL